MDDIERAGKTISDSYANKNEISFESIEENRKLFEQISHLSVVPDAGERPLSDQAIEGLHKLARAMLSLIDQLASTQTTVEKGRNRLATAILAKRIYAERVRRNHFFPSNLFGEPAWDILLDLYVAEGTNELRAIKEVCLASHSPDATALRYIAQLAALGLVKHSIDRTDLRRKFLRLTTEGRNCVAAYLGSMPTLGDEGCDIANAMFQGE